MSTRLLGRAADALRAGRNLRLVARARLVLPDASEQQRALFLIEDALNTADFGDCGRLIVVRRLRLPRLPAGASSHSVALALEQAWRDAAPRAVAFDDARAAKAEVIFAPDADTARAVLLARILGGADTEAWFWPRLVPEFDPGAPIGASASRIVAAAFAEPSAWRALAKELLAWPEARIAALLCLLPAEPGTVFSPLRAAAAAVVHSGFPAAAQEPGAAAEVTDIIRPPRVATDPTSRTGAAAAIAARLLPRPALARELALAPGDWRLMLLAHAAWTAAHHPTPGAPDLAAVAWAWHAPAGGAAPPLQPDAERQPPRPAPQAQSRRATPKPAPVVTLRGPLPEIRRHPAETRSEGPTPRTASRVFRDLAIPWLDGALVSDSGGLLMALNVLQHLGFDSWLALQAPDLRRPLGAAMLSRLAARAGVAADDPQRELFALDDEERARALESTCVWSGHAWPRWLGWRTPRSGETSDRALRWWSAAVRRALRIAAGLSLSRVVGRRAWVSATPTHVDVVFPLGDVDLALRRAGLDADPGWVPWFGRIVAFYYLELPEEPGHA